ncbi:endolytic transglycosylase MltG [Domibacillus indicus]|uniref:endolytic transglycosylase MltG n=1 Tax=Domibacillus indicus TaxID=1437523 RepID=UPI000617F2A6|nr:endolytic transglycosylase MltG [Domibacillus indicus]
MTKQSIRSFGIGLLAASAALFVFNQSESNKSAELSTEEMIQLLEEENYTVQKADSSKEQEPASEQTSQAQRQPGKAAAQPVTILVESGMSSSEVAVMLKEAGLVDDAEAFNQYLTETGYANRLQTGSFTFQPGMTDEKLAEILTN